MASLDALVRGERTNATIGWVLVGVVVVAAAASLLTGAVLWGLLAAVVVTTVAAPAVATRDPSAMLPWPLVAVAAAAVAVRAAGYLEEISGYVAIAALALSVVVELDAFTPVEMTRRFAVAFAVLTTMAVQGWWTVAQYYSDRWLGTTLLRSQAELQWDFVAVTAVALVIGGLFEWYFRRVGEVPARERPADGVEAP